MAAGTEANSVTKRRHERTNETREVGVFVRVGEKVATIAIKRIAVMTFVRPKAAIIHRDRCLRPHWPKQGATSDVSHDTPMTPASDCEMIAMMKAKRLSSARAVLRWSTRFARDMRDASIRKGGRPRMSCGLQRFARKWWVAFSKCKGNVLRPAVLRAEVRMKMGVDFSKICT